MLNPDMKRFRRAVFCYYVLHCPAAMHGWLIMLGDRVRVDGNLGIDDTSRIHVADWVGDLFSRHPDFESVVHVLLGDTFFERNKRDVILVERLLGRRIIDMWDTDPIFVKYPHLRGLARNLEFEQKMAAARKSATERQK